MLKSILVSSRLCRGFATALVTTLVAGAAISSTQAGVATTSDVTSIVLGTTNDGASTQTPLGGGTSGFSTSTNYTLNYNGAHDNITSYASADGTYLPIAYPGTITTTLVRVAGPYANYNNVVYSRLASHVSGTDTYELNAPFNGDEQSVFNSNNINAGTDDLFGNQGDGNGDNNNIERLDVVFSDGVVATTSLAFAVFERGVVAGHDPFGIAAITAVDAMGHPTAYGPLVRFGSGSNYGTYGQSALLPTDTSWIVTRNLVSDQGAPATSPSANITNQSIGGVTVAVVGPTSANALGITAGTTIYGYSLVGGDVTESDDLLHPENFPLDSNSATGAGGIDLIAYTGVLFNDVTSDPGISLVKTGVYVPAVPASNATTDVFGLALNFNALIFDDFTAQSGDTDNRLGVEGNFNVVDSYSVGTPAKGHPVPVSYNGTVDRLIVGGNFTDSNWGVNGNIVLGGNRFGPDRYLTNGNLFRTVHPITFDTNGNVPDDGSGVSFDTLHSRLIESSTALGACADRGVVTKDTSLPYQADFVGNDPTFNVFNVSSTEWSRNASSINITAPSGSTVVINIHGPSVTISNCGVQLNGVDLQHVVYNYVDTLSLKTTNFAHLGSVLAPHASAKFVAGSIDGCAVLAGPVNSSNGFEFHNFPFTGSADIVIGAGTPPSIHYTFTVSNIGDAPLDNVHIDDPVVPVNGAPISLAPGATDSTTFTADYFPTPAEIASGSFSNTATAYGTVSGGPTVNASSTFVLTFPGAPVPPAGPAPAPNVTLNVVVPAASPSVNLSVNGRATRVTTASTAKFTGTVSGATTLEILSGDASFQPGSLDSLTVVPAGSNWKIRTGTLDTGRNVVKLRATSATGETSILTLRVIKH